MKSLFQKCSDRTLSQSIAQTWVIICLGSESFSSASLRGPTLYAIAYIVRQNPFGKFRIIILPVNRQLPIKENHMSKVKANSSDPNKIFGGLSLDKTCFKVSLSVKDPLRKSMPDSDGADKIVRESNMQDSGAVKVNIALLDKSSTKKYTDPIKELRQYFTDNSVPIGSGKQKFRMITKQNHSKFKSEMNKRSRLSKDGSIEFLREYGTDAFYALQQNRLGDKFDRDLFPEKESLEKAFKSIVDSMLNPLRQRKRYSLVAYT